MFPVGNNLNRGHIYFQDFWKCSSILNKAKQLQFNRKQKLNQKKGERSPPGPYLARPSLPARPVTPYLAPGGRGACRRAVATCSAYWPGEEDDREGSQVGWALVGAR